MKNKIKIQVMKKKQKNDASSYCYYSINQQAIISIEDVNPSFVFFCSRCCKYMRNRERRELTKAWVGNCLIFIVRLFVFTENGSMEEGVWVFLEREMWK